MFFKRLVDGRRKVFRAFSNRHGSDRLLWVSIGSVGFDAYDNWVGSSENRLISCLTSSKKALTFLALLYCVITSNFASSAPNSQER